MTPAFFFLNPLSLLFLAAVCLEMSHERMAKTFLSVLSFSDFLLFLIVAQER